MKRRVAIPAAISLSLLFLAGFGCDKSPAPSIQTNPAPAETAPTKPTTQQLLNGPYKKLMLPGSSLSIQVPQDWKINMLNGGVTFLEGSTPSDQATIQLSSRDPVSREIYASLFDRLQKETQPDQVPDMPQKNQVHEIGMIRISERLSTGRPISTPRVDLHGNAQLDATGNQIVDISYPIRWIFTVFIPDGNMVSYYELNCIGLTVDQYKADKELLEKIFNSIRYESGAAPASTAPAI